MSRECGCDALEWIGRHVIVAVVQSGASFGCCLAISTDRPEGALKLAPCALSASLPHRCVLARITTRILPPRGAAAFIPAPTPRRFVQFANLAP